MFYSKYNLSKKVLRETSRENNVDVLAYTPLHVQIQRMLDSGSSLLEYRRRLNAGCLYSDDKDIEKDTSPFVPVYKPDFTEAERIINSAPVKDSVTPTVEVADSNHNDDDLINNSEVTEKKDSE